MADIDDVALVERRSAPEMPDVYGAFTHMKSERDLSRVGASSAHRRFG
jgi:hypothetical protein